MERSGGTGGRPTLGLIGAGKAVSSWYAPELSRADVDVTAVAIPVDADERHEPVLRRFAAHVFSGPDAWREVLERSGVDAIIVATPNHLHRTVVVEALRRGVHVLVEKPLCTSVADAREILTAAAARPDSIAAVAYKHRYLPAYGRAKELIASGAFGHATRASGTMAHGGPRAWSPRATWFYDGSSAGGGALLDLGVHKMDALLWLLGDRVAAVVADIEPGARGELEEHALARFELAGGAQFTFEASWRAPEPREVLEVEFEHGWLRLDGRDTVVWSTGAGQRTERLPGPTNDAGFYVSGVLDVFVRALLGSGDAAALPPVAAAAHHVAAVEAAYRSRSHRTPVELLEPSVPGI